MNRKELTETVLRALRPVKEEEEVEFKEKEVVKVIISVNGNKAAGNDGIKTRLLKTRTYCVTMLC